MEAPRTLQTALASFWVHFACPDVTWQCWYSLFVDSLITYAEKLGFVISTPLSNRSCVLQVLAGKIEPREPKISRKGGWKREKSLEEASQSKVRAVSARCSVKAMGIAGNRRTEAQT